MSIEKIPLGDVSTLVRGPFGGSLKKSIFVDDGYAVYEQSHAINDQFSEIRYFIDENKYKEMQRFTVEAGDLIMSCSGTMGKVAIAPRDVKKGIINQALLLIKPKPTLLNTYLKYYMESPKFDSELSKHTKGVAIKNVASVKILKSLSIPLPELKEQRRIVSLLDSIHLLLGDQSALLNKKQDASRLVLSAYLQKLFSSNSWKAEKLGNLCNLITDGTHSTPKYVNSGVPFLSVKDLTKGFVDFSDTRFITVEEHNKLTQRCKPEYDDVLYTKVGTTGVAKVVDVQKEFSIFVSVALLKVKESIINNYYLEEFLNSPYAREQAKKRTRGMANKNLVIRDIKEILINFPESLDTQQDVVNKARSFRELIQELSANLDTQQSNVLELKKSILNKAFSGEL